jgi:hypothetical protein
VGRIVDVDAKAKRIVLVPAVNGTPVFQDIASNFTDRKAISVGGRL